MEVKVTWLGHSATLVETNMVKIIIDPFLSGNSLSPVGPDEVDVDMIIVTHGHADHLGDTLDIARRTGAMVLSNFEIVTYLQGQGLENLHPLHIGGGRNFEWGRVKLTIAHHGSSLPDGTYGGAPAGVLMDLGGVRIYHAGDTSLFYDMKLIGHGGLDLALLPIGDNFTMGPDDALEAVKLLAPDMVIPIHYNTFDMIQQDPAEWAIAVKQETGVEVSLLEPGESLELLQ
ncbi:MAG: metal-dependent hydrolase [Deltaproteobacteria bacterium]|nr:metal-dependent hydrolase [Deltaproteobacteria bacterium]